MKMRQWIYRWLVRHADNEKFMEICGRHYSKYYETRVILNGLTVLLDDIHRAKSLPNKSFVKIHERYIKTADVQLLDLLFLEAVYDERVYAGTLDAALYPHPTGCHLRDIPEGLHTTLKSIIAHEYAFITKPH